MRWTSRPYVCAIGNSRRPPSANPIIAPPGPPRVSQSSIRTSQPTPIIVPKPNVKYSMVLRPPRSADDGDLAIAIRTGSAAAASRRHYTRRGGVRRAARTRYNSEMHHQPRASFESPRFAQPATFMRLPHVTDPAGLDVAIVGVPYDGGTSYRPGARLGPREVRAQSSLIRTYSYFQKVAPFDRL